MLVKLLRLFSVITLCLFISACASMQYYAQSVVGHSKLMLAREPIDKVIAAAEPSLQQQLITAKNIRQFAVTDLSLPDNNSYLYYVDLKRKYPVWTVVAADEFSVSPKQWCYPIIGCAAYRGFFSEQKAMDYAAGLKQQGWEVTVLGASAYSTLGWFSDPLLPSMMDDGDAFLAEIVFHELAHQVMYVKNNTSYNEAFASVVGEQGALLWLAKNQVESVDAYLKSLTRFNQFYELLNRLKQDLQTLYLSDRSIHIKRDKKKQLFQQLRLDHDHLKQTQWQGTGYDRWFDTPANNARLAAIATYRNEMPKFERLLKKCEYDFRRFFNVLLSEQSNSVSNNVPESCHES